MTVSLERSGRAWWLIAAWLLTVTLTTLHFHGGEDAQDDDGSCPICVAAHAPVAPVAATIAPVVSAVPMVRLQIQSTRAPQTRVVTCATARGPPLAG